MDDNGAFKNADAAYSIKGASFLFRRIEWQLPRLLTSASPFDVLVSFSRGASPFLLDHFINLQTSQQEVSPTDVWSVPRNALPGEDTNI